MQGEGMKKYIFLCCALTAIFMAPGLFLENYLIFYGAVFMASLFTSWCFIKNEKREPLKGEIRKFSICILITTYVTFLLISNVAEILLMGRERYEERLFRILEMWFPNYVVGHIVVLVIFYILIRISFSLGAKIFFRMRSPRISEAPSGNSDPPARR
jgi:hypothetical protein